jgi:TP901 family phage tail tape measure protein
MAIASLPLDVVGNTAQLRRQIEQIQKTPIILDVKANTRGAAPLGRISGEISEIDKSLAAANARVIAFGASVGAIYALERAVQGLFQSFVNTEKKLADINAVLNLDGGGIAAFGDRLFDVAANTAQSFDTVATAATELARQGLGVDETLRRTNDALILTRLSGLDAAASVEALTAAINSFSTQALNSGEIVNKLANVDAAFAVSSADLAEALSRVGSSASDAGVSFDELIALVTTAQQVTSRGGSVIGNSLKTIFTRLNRQDTLDLLGGLGIETTDAEGKLKNQVQLLRELAVVYDDLNQVQKGEVAEKVGGVFQINILRAALSDLGKEYSIYDRALQTSISSTDEAIQRNAQLNQTIAALGAQTLANVQKSASKIGEGLFGPAANNILNAVNYIAQAANQIDSDGIGAKVGKGIIDGIGKFLGGPGLAILGAVLTKLGLSFAKYLGEASKSILGTNQAAKNQAVIQQAVGSFLAKNSSLYQSILKGQTTATQAAQLFLKQIQAQTVELQRQVGVANAVAAAVAKAANASRTAAAATAAVPVRSGGGKVRAMGHVPNFSASAADAYLAKKKGGYEPGSPQQTKIGGQVINWNGAESLVQYPGAKTPAIVPPENSRAGKSYRKDFIKASGGMDPYDSAKAMGFVPNFAFTIGGKQYRTNAAVAQNIRSGNITESQAAAAGYKPSRNSPAGRAAANKQSQKKPDITVGGPRYAYLYASGGDKGLVASTAYLPDNRKVNFSFSKAGIKKPFNFKDEVNQHITPGFNQIAKKIYPSALGGPGYMMQYFDKSGTNQTLGRLFEAAVLRAVRPKADVSGASGGSNFDIPSLAASDRRAFAEIFSGAPTYRNADFKYSAPGGTAADGNVKSFVAKLLTAKGVSATKKDIFTTPRSTQSSGKKAALGFIPNFAAVSEAVNREIQAGAKPNQIGIDTNNKLKSSSNKMGVGVWSTAFESSLAEGISMAKKSGINPKTKGQPAASGYIPNFAEGDSGDIGAGLTATAINAAILSSLFIGQRGEQSELKRAINEEVQARRDAIKQQRLAEAEKELLDKQEQQRKYKAIQNEKTGATEYVSKKTGRYVDPSLGRKELERIDKNLQSERRDIGKAIDQQTKNLKPNAIDRIKGGVRTPGIGLGAAIAAPILTSMIEDMIPQDTQAGRTAASAVSGIGDVISMAGTGATIGMAGGPKGAAIGAIIGAGVGLWQAFSGTVKEASTDMPELAAAAEAATTDFQTFQDATTTASTALQKYQDIVDSGGSEIEKQKALGEYEQALLNIDPKDMAELDRLMSMGDNFNEAAEKIARLKIPDVARQQATSDIAELIPKIKDLIGKQQVPTKDIEKALADQISKGIFAGLNPKEILDKAGFALDPDLLNKAFDPRAIAQTLEKLLPGTDESSKDLRDRIQQALKDENIAGYIQSVLKEAVQDKAKQAQIVANTQKTADAVIDLNKSMYGGAAGLVANQPKLEPSADQQTVQSLLDWVPTMTGYDPRQGGTGGYKPYDLAYFNDNKDVQEAQQAIKDAAARMAYGLEPTAQQISDVFEGVLLKQTAALQMIGGDVDQAAVIAAGRVREMFDLDNQAVGNMPAIGDLLHEWLAKALDRLKADPQNPQLQKNAKDAQEAYDNFARSTMPKPQSTQTEQMLAKMREDAVKLAAEETKMRREILENTIKSLGKAPEKYEYISETAEEINKKLKEAREAFERDSYWLQGPNREKRQNEISDLESQLAAEIDAAIQLSETSKQAADSIQQMSDCAVAACDSAITRPLKENAAANGTPSIIAEPAAAEVPVVVPVAKPTVSETERNPFAGSGVQSVTDKITSVDQKVAYLQNSLDGILQANQGSQSHLEELITPVSSILDNTSALSSKMDFTLKPEQINQMFKTSSALAQRSIIDLGNSITNDVIKVDSNLESALKLLQSLEDVNDLLTESKSIDKHSENLDKSVAAGNETREDVLAKVKELTGILPIIKQISNAKILKGGCLDICEMPLTQKLDGKTKDQLIKEAEGRMPTGKTLDGVSSILDPNQIKAAIRMWQGQGGAAPVSTQQGIDPSSFQDVKSYIDALASRSGPYGYMSRETSQGGTDVVDAATGTRSWWGPGAKQPEMLPNFFSSTKDQKIEADRVIIDASGGSVEWSGVSASSGIMPADYGDNEKNQQLQNMRDVVSKAFQDAVLDRMQAQNGGGFRLNAQDAFGGAWAGQLPEETRQKINEWQGPGEAKTVEEAAARIMTELLTGNIPEQFFEGGEMTEAAGQFLNDFAKYMIPVNPAGETGTPLESLPPNPVRLPGEPGYEEYMQQYQPKEPADPFAGYVPPNQLPNFAPATTPTPTPTPTPAPAATPTPTPTQETGCLNNESVRKLCSGSVDSAIGSPVGAASGGLNSQQVGTANIEAQQANVSATSTTGTDSGGTSSAGLSQAADSLKTSFSTLSQSAASAATAFSSLNTAVPAAAQALGGLSATLPSVTQGFGQLSSQVPSVNAEFGSLEGALGGFSSRVNEINFDAFNEGIRSIGDSASSLKQVLGTPIRVDISGKIDAPSITTTVNVDSSSVTNAVQSTAAQISQQITAWTRRIESQLQRLASQVAAATSTAQAANRRG